MPTRVEHPETGIFVAEWSDPLTLDDMQWQSDHVLGIVDREGIKRFVVILDMAHCSRIPFDFDNIKQLASSDPRILGYVILQINTVTKMMIRLLSALTHQKYRPVDTMDEAFNAAREMLAEHMPSR